MEAVIYLFLSLFKSVESLVFPAMVCDKYLEREKMEIVMYLLTTCLRAIISAVLSISDVPVSCGLFQRI